MYRKHSKIPSGWSWKKNMFNWKTFKYQYFTFDIDDCRRLMMPRLVSKMSVTAALGDARKGACAKRISDDLGIPTDCLGSQVGCRRRAKLNSMTALGLSFWLPFRLSAAVLCLRAYYHHQTSHPCVPDIISKIRLKSAVYLRLFPQSDCVTCLRDYFHHQIQLDLVIRRLLQLSDSINSLETQWQFLSSGPA